MPPVLQISVFLSSSSSSSQKKSDPRDIHVGIVGAGLAGLRAARFFEENSIRYTILEGSDRIGGRVYPFEYENGYLQHGAEYLNGIDNEIFDIVQKNELGQERVPDLFMLDENVITFVDGKVVSSGINSIWNLFIDSLNETLFREAESCEKLKTRSVLLRINEHFEAFLEKTNIARENAEIFKKLKLMFCNFFQTEWSSPVGELALENITLWDDGTDDEDSLVLNKFGFQKILEKFKSEVSMKNVLLNSKVLNINYCLSENDSKIRVRLENNTDLFYDHVIVTSSLGYLKQFSRKMFSPELPFDKQQAIQNMGFGSNMKIFLEYKNPWWPENVSTIQIAPKSKYPDRFSKLTENLMVFQPSSWASNILIAWIADNGPSEVGIMKNQELLDAINDFLQENLKSEFPSISKAIRVFRHSWIYDEFALGSYSYLKSDTYQQNTIENLTAPITSDENRPLVCFAGEHTSPQMYQTTVGAAESGLREAKRILNYYSMN